MFIYCLMHVLENRYQNLSSNDGNRVSPFRGDGGVEGTERVEWMICHSDNKYRLQRLLLVICQFSESERLGISDCERICLCPCIGKAGKDKKASVLTRLPQLLGS